MIDNASEKNERIFEHDGKTFVIHINDCNGGYHVATFHEDRPVGLNYYANSETAHDLFSQYKENIVKNLVQIAISDIRSGIYLS